MNAMNFLAHVYLSKPDVESRLGNILADVVKGKVRRTLSVRIQHGIRCHQLVDSFTDEHAQVAKARNRFHGPYRRFAGIILDVFFDHLLARNWYRFADRTLVDFTNEVYPSLLAHEEPLPETAKSWLRKMVADDCLLGTGELSDVEDTLKRIEKRLSRPVDIAGG